MRVPNHAIFSNLEQFFSWLLFSVFVFEVSSLGEKVGYLEKMRSD